jgi:hypothetical protein
MVTELRVDISWILTVRYRVAITCKYSIIEEIIRINIRNYPHPKITLMYLPLTSAAVNGLSKWIITFYASDAALFRRFFFSFFLL